MCYNCGCSNPDDNMGHDDNITNQMLTKMAQKQNKDLLKLQKEFLSELKAGKVSAKFETILEKAAKAWEQPLEEAKKNTLSLLESQIK